MAVTPPPGPPELTLNLNDPQVVAEKIKAALPDAVEAASAQGIVVQREKILDVARWLHDSAETKFDYLHNVTSVDWLDHFEVVYHLSNLARGGAPITVKVNVAKEDPTLPSLVPVYAGADFQEREVYDMMGIRFSGHPNLRRILLWEEFAGYPLRKDFKEPYYEEEKKPFGSRWGQGHHVPAEDRNPWHDNVNYPTNFDAVAYQAPRDDIRTLDAEPAARLRTDKIVLNIGPQHPSTHGVLRLRATLDGETIVAVEPIMGYLHRNHEKIGERNMYLQNMPFTDRLDYVTSMANNLAYAVAVEKLMGIKPPERAEYIRVIMAELTRFLNHILAVGFVYNDLGAFYTPVVYGFEERELILDLFEATAGSRMMCNYMRFGGVARDLPEGFLDQLQYLVNERMPRRTDEFEAYLIKNELFHARAKNVGVLPRQMAINLGCAGPVLRATGVKYDVRRAEPYSIYDRLDFDIPVGTNGDLYDRMVIRIAEMRESIKILKQALQQIPAGEIQTGKKNYQVRPPKGAAYGRAENPKGELGFYLVSDGSTNPYRYHVRSPSFINLGALNTMAVGNKIADLVAILGSVDITMGEVDR